MAIWCLTIVRCLITVAVLLLTSCGPDLVFNPAIDMTREQMLAQATHVFVGEVAQQKVESWPLLRFSIPGESIGQAKYWKVVRRDVTSEKVLRGGLPSRTVAIYEYSWTGGASGNWNNIDDGDRALFLVRVDNGRYHVVRDWWRSIFPITTGPREFLPLDEAHTLWERIALMNWWLPSKKDLRVSHPGFAYADPANVLGLWRTAKLLRGLVRHPSQDVRTAACASLITVYDWAQDECWSGLSEADRAYLVERHHCCTGEDLEKGRLNLNKLLVPRIWRLAGERDARRLLTTANNAQRRREFCDLYRAEYPGDLENGCPAERDPPATIVTEKGDVPLNSPWPQDYSHR